MASFINISLASVVLLLTLCTSSPAPVEEARHSDNKHNLQDEIGDFPKYNTAFPHDLVEREVSDFSKDDDQVIKFGNDGNDDYDDDDEDNDVDDDGYPEGDKSNDDNLMEKVSEIFRNEFDENMKHSEDPSEKINIFENVDDNDDDRQYVTFPNHLLEYVYDDYEYDEANKTLNDYLKNNSLGGIMKYDNDVHFKDDNHNVLNEIDDNVKHSDHSFEKFDIFENDGNDDDNGNDDHKNQDDITGNFTNLNHMFDYGYGGGNNWQIYSTYDEPTTNEYFLDEMYESTDQALEKVAVSENGDNNDGAENYYIDKFYEEFFLIVKNKSFNPFTIMVHDSDDDYEYYDDDDDSNGDGYDEGNKDEIFDNFKLNLLKRIDINVIELLKLFKSGRQDETSIDGVGKFTKSHNRPITITITRRNK